MKKLIFFVLLLISIAGRSSAQGPIVLPITDHWRSSAQTLLRICRTIGEFIVIAKIDITAKPLRLF